MRGMNVSQRMTASFALIIAVMLGMAATFYVRAGINQDRAQRVKQYDLGGLIVAARLRSMLTEQHLLTQDLLLRNVGHDARQANGIKLAREKLADMITEIKKNAEAYPPTITLDADREAFSQLKTEWKVYVEQQQQMITLLEDGQQAQALQMSTAEVAPSFRRMRGYLSTMSELNQHEVINAMDDVLRIASDNKRLTLWALPLAVAIAVACGLLLSRSIQRPIQDIIQGMKVLGSGDLSGRLNLGRRDEFARIEAGFNAMADSLRELVSQTQRSAVQLTTSITEIAASSKQQQATVTETAATTSEIGATSREIAATSRDLGRTMREVSAATEQTASAAGSGQMGVARMAEVMQQLTAAAEMVSAKLALLNEKAGGINQVVTTIVKVADQTNLLSLNAAIEAEKAGEYGRGFAVVATEVRRLADQTAVATYDIEQMVRDIHSAVSAGVMGMDKFSEEVRRGNAEMGQVGEQLSQIIQQIQALAPRVQVVSEGMQIQSGGAEQIEQALGQLSEASSQTVDSLRQAGFAIDGINDVANALRQGVSRFKV